jgi:hypothetical protein
MTAGVTAGYAEVAQTIARLTDARDANGHALEHFEDAMSFASAHDEEDQQEEESKATDGSMHSASTTSATPTHGAPHMMVTPAHPTRPAPTVDIDNEEEEKEEVGQEIFSAVLSRLRSGALARTLLGEYAVT